MQLIVSSVSQGDAEEDDLVINALNGLLSLRMVDPLEKPTISAATESLADAKITHPELDQLLQDNQLNLAQMKSLLDRAKIPTLLQHGKLLNIPMNCVLDVGSDVHSIARTGPTNMFTVVAIGSLNVRQFKFSAEGSA